MFGIFYIALFILFHESSSVIYNLNDTEYARMPALFGLDDYDYCLDENDGIYCVLKLDLIDDTDNDLMKLIKEYSKATMKHYNYSYIERGVCVKKTCNEFIKDNTINDSANLTHILDECFNTTIFRSYKLQAKISKLYYCDRKDVKSEINILDWFVAGVFFTIVLINVIVSLYDYVLNNKGDEKVQGNKYLMSFSVMRNWDWLVNSEFEDPKLKSLKPFYGVRTLTNLLTIYGHTLSLIGAGYTDNPHSFEKNYDSSLYLLLFNGMMVVQIFFLMSGFLLTYNFLVRAEAYKLRITWTTIPVGIFLRWWRLTPALAVMIAFSMTWLRHLGSGPLWNFYLTSLVMRDCYKYWWSHIFYFNNYIPDNKYCAIQTWHIASDSQLFLIGLIVLVATTSRGRGVVLTLLLILSLILPAFHVWLHDLDAIAFLTPEFFRDFISNTFFYLHIYGHNNMSSYTVGMIMALFIYNWQNKGVNLSENKIYTVFLWLVIPGMVGVIYSASFFYIEGERPSLVVRMMYAATHRFILSLIVAFGIVGVVMKCRTILRDIIVWRGWVVPSRLTYSVYLIHFNFIYILLGVRYDMIPVSFWFMKEILMATADLKPEPAEMQFTDISYTSASFESLPPAIEESNIHVWYLHIYLFGITTLSYLLSVPFFLMVEAPLNRLMKNLTSTYFVSYKNNNKV